MVSVQLPVCYGVEGFRVRGRIDALVKRGGGRVVLHEVKSVGVCGGADFRACWTASVLSHVLGVENEQLDHVERSILVKGVGKGVDVRFPVERDVKMFWEPLERTWRLYIYLVKGEAQPGEECWLCRHCLHGDECE